MVVRIPTPLRSYTAQAATVTVSDSAATVDAVMAELDRQFPGFRFRFVDDLGRLRQHMKVFVNAEMTRDLSSPVTATDEITVMQALSGG